MRCVLVTTRMIVGVGRYIYIEEQFPDLRLRQPCFDMYLFPQGPVTAGLEALGDETVLECICCGTGEMWRLKR
jgi:hypothetical protein